MKLNAVNLIIYSASDVAKTKSFFATLLGGEPYVESAYYTGFKAGDMEIGLVPKRAQSGQPGSLAYVDVDDINAALATLLAAGAQKVQDVTDVANGLLVASVKDPDGTTIGLRQFPKT
ncbi:MAG TPA: VOC family protein [Candidatus Nitrosotalea sp.]|nr:VOC family protein [Candidatus Nitrosotalea sp.]